MIPSGNYKAKAVKGSAQLGETDKGTLQIAVDLDVKGPDGASLGSMTTLMYFSTDAASYSYERLGLLGWTGKGPNDLNNLDTIYANEVDVIIKAPESYKANDGTMKTGAAKIEILTGSGRITLNKPLDKNTFIARLKAIGAPAPAADGNSGGGGKPASGTGAPF